MQRILGSTHFAGAPQGLRRGRAPAQVPRVRELDEAALGSLVGGMRLESALHVALRRFVSCTFLALPLAALGLGCAPIASFRPASGLMPEKSVEVGVGAAMVSARPYVTENSASAGQAWVTGNASQVVSLSGITAFDSDAIAAGGAMRINALRLDRLALGVEGELGYVWAAMSVPFAVRLVDQTWAYAAPRFFTWGIDLSYGTPVGVSVRVIDGFCLRAEWQRSWQDFKYYNRRDHFGIAVAQQL